MKITILKPLLLFILLGSLTLSSCNSFAVPEYKEFKNLKLEQLGLAASTVQMDLVYYNPNRIGFQVRRTEADVYVDGVYLGRALSDTLIRVSKKSEFIIPVRIQTDMKNLMKNAWMALTNQSVLIKANGTITVGVAGIFKTIPLEYEGRQEMPKIGFQP